MRLGIIGMSEGNGHPYSWSAICNGYDADIIADCGFPAIPSYLAARAFPHDQLAGAAVTHVWTQDRARSEHIARATMIGSVVDDPRDMIGQIDGLLLARDDAQNHRNLALPFLAAGLPVYIDKPLALSIAGARDLFAAQLYPGQIFTCTALRYAAEFQLSDEDRATIGPVRHIHATTPKYWDTYAVHMIEPALNLVPERGELAWTSPVSSRGRARILSVGYSSGVEMTFTAFEDAVGPISIRIIGEKSWRDLVFADSFSAFRSALSAFVSAAEARRQAISNDFTLEVVRLIEAGRAS